MYTFCPNPPQYFWTPILASFYPDFADHDLGKGKPKPIIVGGTDKARII